MNKNVLYGALLASAFFLPLQTQAADNVDQRLQQLEKAVAEKSKAIEKLEKKLKRTDKVQSKTNNKLDETINRIQFNGFMSAGVSKHNGPSGFEFSNTTSTPSWQPDTVLGLQMTANIDPKTSVIVQLVGHGQDFNAWDTDMEWAFVRYRATNNLTFRAGRFRTPFYMFSDFLEVGFSYPWTRPPTAVYNLPVSGEEGMDVIWNYNIGDWSGYLQADWGTSVSNQKFLDVQKAGGLNTSISKGAWTFRAGHRVGAVRILEKASLTNIFAERQVDTSPLKDLQGAIDLNLIESFDDNDEMSATYSSIGFQYDNGALLVISELVKLEWKWDDFSVVLTDDTLNGLNTTGYNVPKIVNPPLFSGYTGAYITTGYRIGKFLPYVTASRIENESNVSDGESLAWNTFKNGVLKPFDYLKYNIYTAGVRYDLTSNIALKASLDHLSNNGGRKDNGDFGPDLEMDGHNVFVFLVDVIF